MSHVLITGGAGFIGLHLAQALIKEGHEIDLLDNFSRGVLDWELEEFSKNSKVKFIKTDLLKPDSLPQNQYDFIYHLAAIIGVAHVLSRPYEVLADNTKMLLAVIEFAKAQKNLKRFIFASTSEVYAGTLENFELKFPTPESTPLALTKLDHPRTSYMLSKIYGEALCQHSGLNFTIIRPHNFYGPRMGMSHVVPELFKKAHDAVAGSDIEVASLLHKRAFCYIDDAIEMIICAAQSESCRNQTLNIGSEEEVTIGNLAQSIFKIAEKEIKIKDKGETPGSPKRRCPDMSLTEKLTGAKAQISLTEGLKKTYSWYRENIFSNKTKGAL
jgi:UDP-glucose 4-epimerase